MSERLPKPIPANESYEPVPDAVITPAKQETKIVFDGLEINGAKLSDMLVVLGTIAEETPSRISPELVTDMKEQLSQMGKRDIIVMLNNGNSTQWRVQPHLYQALFELLREPRVTEGN
ncbi:MAG TPA: hypothetical protein VGE53_00295 [Candidatus Paceibacterota bacterium]